MLGNLRYMDVVAAGEIEHLSGLDTLLSGGDSEHIDRLLKNFFPILERNDLSTSYTTREGESADRRAPAVKLAMLLVPLWPDEIGRPTGEAVMARLVKLRAEIRKRADNNK